MSVNIYQNGTLTPIAGKTVPMPYTPAPQSMIGDAWVLGHAYAVGDYSIDANGLYKNGTAHTSTATNRPSVNQSGYWTLVSVASQLGGGGVSWTNPASSSPFAAQTISGITANTDDTIILGFLVHSDSPSNLTFREIMIVSAYRGGTYTLKSTSTTTTRNMTINSNGTISFSESTAGATDAGRKYLVPVKISII